MPVAFFDPACGPMVRWAVDLSVLPPLPGFAQLLAGMFENRLSRVRIVQGSVEICPAKADRDVELIADALEYMLVGALDCHEWCQGTALGAPHPSTAVPTAS